MDDASVTDEEKSVTIMAIANDTDVEDDTLTVATLVQPARGSAVVQSSGCVVVYTPRKDFNGNDAFAYSASDGVLEGNLATVEITVRPVNDAPVASEDFLETFAETAITFSPLKNDIDIDGDPLTIVDVTQPSNGVASLDDDGTVTYTPNEGFLGVDRFTYRISDSEIESPETIISMTVVEAPEEEVATSTPMATPTSTPATLPETEPEPTPTRVPDEGSTTEQEATPTASAEPESPPAESPAESTNATPTPTEVSDAGESSPPPASNSEPDEQTAPTPPREPSSETSQVLPTPTPSTVLVPTAMPTVAPFFYPTALPTKTPFAFSTIVPGSAPASTNSGSDQAPKPTVTPKAPPTEEAPNDIVNSTSSVPGSEGSAVNTTTEPVNEGGLAFGFCSSPPPGHARRVDLSLLVILIGAVAVGQKQRFFRLR